MADFLPSVSELLHLPMQSLRAAQTAVSLVPAVFRIVNDVDALLARVRTVLGAVEDIANRAGKTVRSVDEVVAGAAHTVGRAGDAVDDARSLVAQISKTRAHAEDAIAKSVSLIERVSPLLDTFVPLLTRLEPLLDKLVSTTSPDEVDALVHLIDTTPELVDKLREDILPTLDTLGSVAPDLRDLLEVSRELNEIIGSVPGLGRIKRRVEEEQAVSAETRAATDH